MEKAGLEKQVLTLGREHLKAAQEDDWNRWEAIAAERERLYATWQAAGKILTPLSASAVRELKKIDRFIVEIIEKNKGEVLTELNEVRRARQAMMGYKAGGNRRGEGTRLKITC